MKNNSENLAVDLAEPLVQTSECWSVHTPTPWGVSEYEGRQIIQDSRFLNLAALMVNVGANSSDKANAEFICRAVNSHQVLVDALKQLLDYADRIHRLQNEEGEEVDYETFPTIRAALAQAENP